MSTTATHQMSAESTRWRVDPAQSVVGFAVKTFWGAMTVHGRFDRFDGWYDVGPDGVSIGLAVDADSLDTGHPTRDRHLRSADFFDVGSHPRVHFASTSVRENGNGALHVEGTLSAAGTAVPVEFDATVRQIGDELEVEATPTVDQRSFGMHGGLLGMIRPPAKLHVKVRLVNRR